MAPLSLGLSKQFWSVSVTSPSANVPCGGVERRDYVAFIGIYKFQYLLDHHSIVFWRGSETQFVSKQYAGGHCGRSAVQKINTGKMTTALNTNRRSIVMQLVVEALSRARGEMRHNSCLLKSVLAIVLNVMSFLDVVARDAAQF